MTDPGSPAARPAIEHARLAEELIATYGVFLTNNVKQPVDYKTWQQIRDGAHPGEACSAAFVAAIARAGADDRAPAPTPEMILKVDDMLPQRQAMLSSEAALRAAALDAAPATDVLRRVWEHGIQIAICYGDNVHHLQGAQADRIFDALLAELAGAAGTVPSSTDQDRLGEWASIKDRLQDAQVAGLTVFEQVETLLKLAAGTVPPSAPAISAPAIADAFLSQYKPEWKDRVFYLREHLIAFAHGLQLRDAAAEVALATLREPYSNRAAAVARSAPTETP